MPIEALQEQAAQARILAAVDVAALPDHVFRAPTESDEIVRWWSADDVYRTTGWIWQSVPSLSSVPVLVP